MKKKKSVTILIIAGILILAITSCGKADSTEAPSADTSGTAVTDISQEKSPTQSQESSSNAVGDGAAADKSTQGLSPAAEETTVSQAYAPDSDSAPTATPKPAVTPKPAETSKPTAAPEPTVTPEPTPAPTEEPGEDAPPDNETEIVP